MFTGFASSRDHERLRFSPTVDDGCCHFVTEKLQESDEIGMTSKHGQTSPRGFTIDGIKCLDQVNEDHK